MQGAATLRRPRLRARTLQRCCQAARLLLPSFAEPTSFALPPEGRGGRDPEAERLAQMFQSVLHNMGPNSLAMRVRTRQQPQCKTDQLVATQHPLI